MKTFLRVIVMILLSLTAAMTLMGGAGTSCVAFRAENWESMAALIPVKPIFQVLVVVSIAAAIYGIYAIVQLGRGKKGAYKMNLIFLGVGLIASAIQFYFSLTLRGKTAPNNMRLYITVFTLLVFLLMRLPGIWQRTGFAGRDAGSGPRAASGAALIVTGLVTITTPLWAAPTHVMDGYNTANELLWPLLLGGAVLIIAGGLVLRSIGEKKAVVAVPSTAESNS